MGSIDLSDCMGKVLGTAVWSFVHSVITSCVEKDGAIGKMREVGRGIGREIGRLGRRLDPPPRPQIHKGHEDEGNGEQHSTDGCSLLRADRGTQALPSATPRLHLLLLFRLLLTFPSFPLLLRQKLECTHLPSKLLICERCLTKLCRGMVIPNWLSTSLPASPCA